LSDGEWGGDKKNEDLNLSDRQWGDDKS